MEKKIEQNTFLNKRKIGLLVLFFSVSIVLTIVTLTQVLKIEFQELFFQMGAGLSIKYWPLFLLIIYLFLRTVLASIPTWIRIRQLGYRASFFENILFDFTYFFLSAITPANFFTDPYTIFWIKTFKVSNAKAFSIVATNGFIWQTVQLLVTIPSFIIIAIQYNDFHLRGWDTEMIYWLMVSGLIIDVFGMLFFSITSFSKRMTYTLSLFFNWLKKIIRFKYHTKSQVKEKYLRQGELVQISIGLMKNYKGTIINILCYTFCEMIMYIAVFLSLEWILPKETTINFWDAFNCANVAITANKFVPAPGNQGTLEWTLQHMMAVCCKPNGGSSSMELDENIINNSIVIWRFFSLYFISIIGAITFVISSVRQYKKFKYTKNEKN